jgi:hypothetical protein
MPALTYVLLLCKSCAMAWKQSPEKVYELRRFADLSWSQLRSDLKCPACKGPLTKMPEYGEPLYHPFGFWPTDIREGGWMS